ncbi:hypothetical protein, partial [Providencia stuartii]
SWSDEDTRFIAMRTTAIFIKANNDTEKLTSQSANGEFTLEELQNYVGGDIQTVSFQEPIVIDDIAYSLAICDEEGKYKNYLRNENAT